MVNREPHTAPTADSTPSTPSPYRYLDAMDHRNVGNATTGQFQSSKASLSIDSFAGSDGVSYSDVIPLGVDVSFDVVDLAYDDCPYSCHDGPVEIVAALPELSRALASKHQNLPKVRAIPPSGKGKSTDAASQGPPGMVQNTADLGRKQKSILRHEATRMGNAKKKIHTKEKGRPETHVEEVQSSNATNALKPNEARENNALGTLDSLQSETMQRPQKRRRQHEGDGPFAPPRSHEPRGEHHKGDRRNHFQHTHGKGISQNMWNDGSYPQQWHHSKQHPPQHFQGHSHRGKKGNSNGDWGARAAMEREWNTRRQEMDALSIAQATKQRELDYQAVDLETRERELGDQRRHLETTYAYKEKELNALKDDMEAIRHHGQLQLEKERAELNIERDEFKLSSETGMRELKALRTQQEGEIAAELAALQTFREELKQVETEQTRVLDAKREQHEVAVDVFKQERDRHLSAQRTRQTELDAREDAQTLRENKWQSTVAQEKAEHASNTRELDARSTQLEQQHTELQNLKRSLEIAQARQQEEFQGWTLSKAQQQEEVKAWVKQAVVEQEARTKELDAREKEQVRLQMELDARAVALKKHATKGRPNQPQAKVDKPLATPESRAKHKASGNHAEPNRKPMTQKSSQGKEFILVDSDSDSDKRKVKRSNFPAEQTRRPVDATASRNSATRQAVRSTDYNYLLTEETALEMQERLLREAAAKMRAQPQIRVSEPKPLQIPVVINAPIFNIADLYPNHWTWADPYAVLGLPSDSSITMVKSQFRRLARRYHPDTSPDGNACIAKFHAISTTYHNLMQDLST